MVTAWRNRIVGSGEEAPDQLLANPKNWRVHPREQQRALEGSLDTVGWVQQVLVNKQTGHLVDGHARVEQAISRGEVSVPVLYVDLTEEEEALVLATLDPIAAMAGTDRQKLDELVASISIDDEGLNRLLGDLVPLKIKDGLTDPDDVPELGEESNVKRGDIFALGEHRLMCGDAATDVATLMAGEMFDLMWTDPPYGVEYVGKTKRALTIENDDDPDGPLVETVFRAVAAFASPRAPFYCAGPAGQHIVQIPAAIVAAGWQLHQELVWVKDTMVLGHSDYHFRHEPVFYGYLAGDGRPGRGKHEGSRWHGDHSQTSVLHFDRPKRSASHPTMKPEALVEYCICNSSGRGEIVLDPFSGSGTTIIAAERSSRKARAMEIDPRYVAVIIERWEQYTGEKAVRLGG